MLLKQSGQIEASRFVIRAVRESGVAALQMEALQKLDYFPNRVGGKAFVLPKNTNEAVAYLKEITARLIQEANNALKKNDAPAPLEFFEDTQTATAVELQTWNEENTLGATPAPLGFLAPSVEDTDKILPEYEAASTSEPVTETPSQEQQPEVNEPPDVDDTSEESEEEDLFETLEKEDLPYDLPFFDGVDRLFFAGHEAIAYFVQSLYHHNAIPFSTGTTPEEGQEFALSLINHNQTTSLLDTQIHVSKSGQAYFIFEHLQEVETEARNVCEDLAWTKIRSMLSSKPRPPRTPELRADTTILFRHRRTLLPSVMI